MKKFFQSKGFIVSSLALLCITILGVCWFVSRDRTGDFRPDESPPSSVTGDWSDGGTQTDGDNGADAYAPGQSTDAEEEYPKVSVKDWLYQNFKREDKEYVKREYEIATELGKLMRAIAPAMRQGIVFKVLYYRYYNFDLDQPFQPQYEQNNRHLLADLHRIAGEQ